MSNIKRHVGVIKNTGARVAVVFREIPNDPNNCLVVETDRLPDGYHDNLINTINSKEGQETVNLYEVLNRRTFHDGSTCLPSLHQRGFLRKVPISDVDMLPAPNKPVPLELVNAHINGTVEQYKAKQTSHADIPLDTPLDKARALILKARDMEHEAAKMKEEAYLLVPELRPEGRGRPRHDKLHQAVSTNKFRKVKKEKYAKSLDDALMEEIDAAVDAKLLRDAQKQV